MIQEQSGVEMIGQVGDEAISALAHHEILRAGGKLAVLVVRALAVTLLQRHPFKRNIQCLCSGLVHGREPVSLCAEFHHRLSVFLQMGAIGIKIQSKRQFRNIPIVDPEAFDAGTFRPFF